MAPRDSAKPNPDSQRQARLALEFLVRERGPRYQPGKVFVSGKKGSREPIELPDEVAKLLGRILTEFANGNSVSVVSVHAELTTQEAAGFLNVSRPHLIGLLEAGKIPFRTVGTHRRVRLSDLLRYQSIETAKQKKALDELAAEAQKLGLGY